MSRSKKRVNSKEGYSGIYNRAEVLKLAIRLRDEGATKEDFINRLTHNKLGNPGGVEEVYIRATHLPASSHVEAQRLPARSTTTTPHARRTPSGRKTRASGEKELGVYDLTKDKKK